MHIYYSMYWFAWLAQYKDAKGDLRTFIAPTRERAIEKALQAMFNTK